MLSDFLPMMISMSSIPSSRMRTVTRNNNAVTFSREPNHTRAHLARDGLGELRTLKMTKFPQETQISIGSIQPHKVRTLMQCPKFSARLPHRGLSWPLAFCWPAGYNGGRGGTFSRPMTGLYPRELHDAHVKTVE